MELHWGYRQVTVEFYLPFNAVKSTTMSTILFQISEKNSNDSILYVCEFRYLSVHIREQLVNIFYSVSPT